MYLGKITVATHISYHFAAFHSTFYISFSVYYYIFLFIIFNLKRYSQRRSGTRKNHSLPHTAQNRTRKRQKRGNKQRNTGKMKNALWAKSERPARVERRKPLSLFSSFFLLALPHLPHCRKKEFFVPFLGKRRKFNFLCLNAIILLYLNRGKGEKKNGKHFRRKRKDKNHPRCR